MKNPTAKEIKKEIEWLKKDKRKIVQLNSFGENNWSKIESSIEVLEGNLSEEECNDKVESGEWTEQQYDAARSILGWRDEGDESCKPSVDWSAVVKG